MKIVTWNVNSIKARLPRLLEFLETHGPTAVCLQETKTTSDAFPHDELAEVGYQAVEHSSGRWTGVAILAPEDVEITDVTPGLPGTPVPEDARWIEATIEGVRIASVYVVNGRALDDPMFPKKLEFLSRLIDRTRELADEPLVVTGDFNIAPEDRDVYDPSKFEGATHVTPEERAKLGELTALGLVDAFRHRHPDEVQHTWWDYRMGHFHRGMGLRIDLAFVTAPVAGRLREVGIDRTFRKGTKPSDHAPLILTVDRG